MNRLLYLLFPLLFIVPIYSIGQNSSMLYNNKSQLIADTNVILSINAFKSWKEIEEDVLSSFFNYFETPQFFIDWGAPFSGVFSFEFNKENEQFHRVILLKQLEGKYSLPEVKEKSKQYITKAVKKALNESISGRTLYNLRTTEDNYTYFIPVILDIKRVDHYINNEGALILKSTFPAF